MKKTERKAIKNAVAALDAAIEQAEGYNDHALAWNFKYTKDKLITILALDYEKRHGI